MNREEALAAARRVLARVDATLAEAESGFPEFAEPGSPTWHRNEDGSWCGGFWVGQLWLAAACFDRERYQPQAARWCEALRGQAEADTVFRAFLFWYGAALGARLLDDEVGAAVAAAGAAGLERSFDPAAGLVPAGTYGSWSSPAGVREAWVDGVPALAPLLLQVGGEGAERGLTHVERLADLCVRADGSVSQVARFDPADGTLRERLTPNGSTDDSTWSRAQAWAVLGFAQAAGLDRARFEPVARRVADWWLAHIGPARVAPWDFDVEPTPTTYLDTSATAIAAAGMLKLAALPGSDRSRYRQGAVEMVAALVAGHLSGAEGGAPGRLLDGCYNGRKGFAVEAELIWGNYFLLESLLVIAGALDPGQT